MKRKYLFWLLPAMLLLALLLGGVAAYENRSAAAKNIITTGGISIRLLEYDAEGQQCPDSAVEIIPTATVERQLGIHNQSRQPAWLRIQLWTETTLADKTVIQNDPNVILTPKPDGEYWLLQDGYLYYLPVLEGEGDTTLNLPVTFRFSENMDNAYIGATVRIHITAQAVQQKNNDAEDARFVSGWPKGGTT